LENNSNKLKIIFCGMPDMATVCLSALHKKFDIAAVIPPPLSNPTSANFINFANQLGYEVLIYQNDPNSPEVIEKIKEKQADIGVICSFNTKFSKEFLATTKLGYINCHPSLLPNYRGANPYFHVINNDEKTSGVTLHFADENFDTGAIIAQRGFALNEKETIGTIFNKCNFIIAEMLIQVLSDLQEGKEITTKEQINGDYPKAIKIPSDIKLDLRKKPKELERLVRACNPFYNSYMLFRGAPLRIYNLDFTEKDHMFEYGLITKIEKDAIEIAVNGGYIYPKTLQSGSWGIFDSSNFINVFNPKVGEKFE